MLGPKFFTFLSIGLLAGACANPYDRPAPVPSVALTVSERNCLDYGFTAGTTSYNRCVDREARARGIGRVNRDYAEARLNEDARDACYSYGLEPGSSRYNSCVAREIDARVYRGEAYVVPAPVYVPAYAPPPPEAYVDRRVATTGVEVFRDEYGFRYDAQGNRIDTGGRIISPQSTRP